MSGRTTRLFINAHVYVIIDGYTFGYPTNFEDEISFTQFVRKAVSSTSYDTDVEVQYGDKILLLSTCNYSFGGARYIVLGKMVEAGKTE